MVLILLLVNMQDIDLLRAMDIGGQIATIITGELATDINMAIKQLEQSGFNKTNYDESQQQTIFPT